MRYGESLFDICYLLFAIISGCIILKRSGNITGKLMSNMTTPMSSIKIDFMICRNLYIFCYLHIKIREQVLIQMYIELDFKYQLKY